MLWKCVDTACLSLNLEPAFKPSSNLVHSCSYDYLEIEEIAVNGTEHPADNEWFPAEYRSHEHFSDENEVSKVYTQKKKYLL